MRPRWIPDEEFAAFGIFAAIAGVGSWLHSTPLATFGGFGALTTVALYSWQRWCLTGVSYRRDLDVVRAQFGEEVVIRIELVNDKLLPLPWVRVEDEVPSGLGIEGAAARVIDEFAPIPVVDPTTFVVVHNFAMLPLQRTQRTLRFVCRKRGRHRFGSSTVISGDPLGLRHRQVQVQREIDVIVYPKMFALSSATFRSLAPFGDDRSTNRLISDPTRVAGMRAYRSGDALRHVDWRSTARRGELLVRDFEATSTLRIGVFVDLACDVDNARSDSVMEFRIAVAASLIVHFAALGAPVGLYASGRADGIPISHDPSFAPGALTPMLELLALCEPDAERSLADLLVDESSRLKRGSVAIVIASQFSEATLVALAECRRRAPVTTIFVDAGSGLAPDGRMVDQKFSVEYQDDWPTQDRLQLAS